MKTRTMFLLAALVVLMAAPALADYPDDCLGMDAASGTDCMGLTYEGCCDLEGRLVWCDNNQLYCLPCPDNSDPSGQSCGWSADAGFYDCGASTEPDPTGEFPRDCESAPETCENGTCDEGETCANCAADCGCPDGQSCYQAACCTPSCDGKECGDDGCGGTCASCDIGMICDNFTCTAPTEICTASQAVSCDDVISGTNVGGTSLFDAACSPWATTGPEIVYSFTPAVDDLLILELTEGGDTLDHDLGVMGNYCTDGACMGYGDTGANIEVEAGKTYYIVVDGYDGSAGPFTLNVRCRSTCVPDCDGKECGDDGCGGQCGAEECGGWCVEGVCYDEGGCTAYGDTGCGGCECESCVCEIDPYCCGDSGGSWDEYCQMYCLLDCGGCGVADTCGDSTCVGAENCTNCEADCGCADGATCFNYECCTPDCDGKNCGDDGCGGTCGECDAGYICDETQQCVVCTPDCTDMECGDDGCGGSCGECAEGSTCASGKCVGEGATYPDVCLGFSEPSAPTCGDVDDIGCCDDSGRVVFCYENELYCGDCGENPSCGWNGEYGYYDCGTDGSEGTSPMACPEVQVCTPDCTDKECGSDGCDGTCGTCDAGFSCDETQHCVTCTPDCTDKACGDDGCGGSCGTCNAGFTCVANACQEDVVDVDVISQDDVTTQNDTVVPADTTSETDTTPTTDGGSSGGCTTAGTSSNAALVLMALMVLGLAVIRRSARGNAR